MKKLTLTCIGLAMSLFSHAAKGDVLFSDFGTGNSYNCCSGSTISSTGSGYSAQASAFTLSGSGLQSLSQIDIAIGQLIAGGGFSVNILTDNNGALGTQVAGASWAALQPAETNFGSVGSGMLTSITGISGVTLTGGDTYYLEITPTNPQDNTWYAWNLNNIGLNTDQYATSQGSSWTDQGLQTAGAFDLLGSPMAATPEPGTLLLAGSGLAALTAALRRRLARG